MVAARVTSLQLRSRGHTGYAIVMSLGAALVCSHASGFNMQVSRVFAGSPMANQGQRALRLGRTAEPETPPAPAAPAPAAPAPAPSPSVALVVVNDENTATTASILGGVAGALLGGVWVGGALFAAASYFSRKDGDVSTVFKGVASTALETLNFGAGLNDKYKTTDQIGSALSGAVDNLKANAGGGADALNTVTGAVDSAVKVVEDLDKDVNIKGTVGGVFSSASELAAEAIDKAVELNEEYKITGQIADKAKEVASKVQEQLK